MNNDTSGNSSGGRRGRVLPGILGAVHDNIRTFPEGIDTKEGVFNSQREAVAELAMNFVAVNVANAEEFSVEQHHVDFSPPIDSKKLRIDLLSRHAGELGVKNTVFNGQMLFLPHRYKGGVLHEQHPTTGAPVTITVRWTSHLPADDPQTITVLNTINRNAMIANNYQQFNRHFFDPSRPTNVPSLGLIIWPGIVSAIRPYDAGLLMCVDVAHKVIRQETVYDVLLENFKQYGADAYKTASNAALTGQTVLTIYNNKTHRIDDIDYDQTPLYEFTRSDDTTQSLLDYVQQNYASYLSNIVIDPNQPLIVVRAKKIGPRRKDTEMADTSTLYLIPQLCRMTGLTDEMRAKRHTMQELAQFQRVTPQVRVDAARAHVRKLMEPSSRSRALLDEWGISLSDDVVKITSRQFNPETLSARDGRQFTYRLTDADWTRSLVRDVKVLTPVPLKHWAIVFPNQSDYAQLARNFFASAKRVAAGLGIGIDDPLVKASPGSHLRDMVLSVKDAIDEYQAARGVKPDMVVVVSPDDTKARYDAVKRALCIDHSVPSQVVLVRTLRREKILDSIVAKVLMQMNCKMGGALWAIDNPFYSRARKHIMVGGYDSYFDSSERGKAVGTAVWTMNPELTQFYATYRKHSGATSESNNLRDFTTSAMHEYYRRNKCLPVSLYLYRDGVGEGQIPVVFNTEVQQTLQVLRVMAETEVPKLTFIIVNKSINHRFYLRSGTGYINPLPGTVVDKICTRQERYDFYLVPQAVNQGTVSPVAFNVIEDQNRLKAAQLQLFTYKLTHLYYNWQGTIRVPAPCQYAHKLAFLISQSVHDDVDPQLCNKLFFL